MTSTLRARYVRTSSGYMGQILEWPQVVTEGESLETCREALQDALEQMVLAYKEQGAVPPAQHSLFE